MKDEFIVKYVCINSTQFKITDILYPLFVAFFYTAFTNDTNSINATQQWRSHPLQ